MTKRRGDPGWKNSSQSPWTSWGHSSAGPASGVDARADATTSFVHDGFHHHTIQEKERSIHSGKEATCTRETRTKREYILRWTARASKRGQGWVEILGGGEVPCVFENGEQPRGTGGGRRRGRNTDGPMDGPIKGVWVPCWRDYSCRAWPELVRWLVPSSRVFLLRRKLLPPAEGSSCDANVLGSVQLFGWL